MSDAMYNWGKAQWAQGFRLMGREVSFKSRSGRTVPVQVVPGRRRIDNEVLNNTEEAVDERTFYVQRSEVASAQAGDVLTVTDRVTRKPEAYEVEHVPVMTDFVLGLACVRRSMLRVEGDGRRVR